MLTRVEGENNYLDYTKLDYRNQTTSLAYLLDARVGFSEKVGGFYVFYFKDVNGVTITGRMFDVERLNSDSYTLSTLKRKPVMFTHTSQIFNGAPSLIVTSLEVFNGEFDYVRFLGEIPSAKEDLKYANDLVSKYVGNTFPVSWETESYLDVCNGRSGGLAKLTSTVLKNLSNYENTPGVVFKDLLTAVYVTLVAYKKYLVIESTVEVPMRNQLLEIIYNSTANLDVRMRNVVADCCSAVMGLGAPEHLYSHIIHNTLESSKRLLNFSYEYPAIMEGSAKKVGEFKLSKY